MPIFLLADAVLSLVALNHVAQSLAVLSHVAQSLAALSHVAQSLAALSHAAQNHAVLSLAALTAVTEATTMTMMTWTKVEATHADLLLHLNNNKLLLKKLKVQEANTKSFSSRAVLNHRAELHAQQTGSPLQSLDQQGVEVLSRGAF